MTIQQVSDAPSPDLAEKVRKALNAAAGSRRWSGARFAREVSAASGETIEAQTMRDKLSGKSKFSLADLSRVAMALNVDASAIVLAAETGDLRGLLLWRSLHLAASNAAPTSGPPRRPLLTVVT